MPPLPAQPERRTGIACWGRRRRSRLDRQRRRPGPSGIQPLLLRAVREPRRPQGLIRCAAAVAAADARSSFEMATREAERCNDTQDGERRIVSAYLLVHGFPE